MVDERHVLRRVFNDEHPKFFVHSNVMLILRIFFSQRNRVKCGETNGSVLQKEAPENFQVPNSKLQRNGDSIRVWSFPGAWTLGAWCFNFEAFPAEHSFANRPNLCCIEALTVAKDYANISRQPDYRQDPGTLPSD